MGAGTMCTGVIEFDGWKLKMNILGNFICDKFRL